jgi:hypothetical protein
VISHKKKKETTMLNQNDVISQARDKRRENLQWIETETKLRQALGTGESRRKMPREGRSIGVIELLKSLILLMKPGVGQGADR